MSPPSGPWRPSYKILVASPDPKMRRLMCISLDEFGTLPTEASDGVTLLREAYAVHPDLIVMQRELPDKDGLEVLAKIRGELHLHRPPVIVLTKGLDADARLACFAAEADDVMSMPFDARELRARVEAVLRRGRSRVIRNPFAEKHLTALAGNIFDTFVEGRANRAAVEAARAVAENLGSRFNPLFIYGPPGVGKTHLLSAIGHYLSSTAPEKVMMYVPTSEFSDEFLAAIATGEMELFRSKYGHADVLLLDDIQYLGGGDSLFTETARLFLSVTEHGRQIVASADRSLEELRTTLHDVYPVLGKGLITKIDLPDRDLRYRILQTQNLIHKWSLSDHILALIADIVASDARALQGAARKLVALRSIQGGVLTAERAREAIADLARGEEVIEQAAIMATATLETDRGARTGSYELRAQETARTEREVAPGRPPPKKSPAPPRQPATEPKQPLHKSTPEQTARRSSAVPTVRPPEGKRMRPSPARAPAPRHKKPVSRRKSWFDRLMGRK